MDPRDLQNYIILYCDYIIQDAHKKNKKKHIPSKAAAIRLTLLLFPMCTKPRARYQNSEPSNQRRQIASSSEASPIIGHANANLNDYYYSFL